VSTPVGRALAALDREAAGLEMHRLAERLYPIHRSITGDGVRRTLEIARELVPLEVHEVPSGTRVFDWTVPPEWSLREAWIAGPDGRRVVDVADHTLHLVSYSAPVDRRMPLAELREHLHSLPDRPELIPYRTSYYRETWGFCLPHATLEALPEGDYQVRIDSTLDPAGSLTYGELVLPGTTDREILVSCHLCHPSLANDNLSALAVTLLAARALAALDPAERRHTLRFLWIPGTIGAITWLALHPDAAARVAHGLVAANLGDPGPFHYKRSRRGDAPIDRAVAGVLADSGEEHTIEPFEPYGYDERQYCSPGFDLPVGSLTRTPWGRYPEYHTSADDLGLIRPEALAGSLVRYLEVIERLEADRVYRSRNPYCEPQLGPRGLYSTMGGGEEGRRRQLALLWVLNLADGRHSLLDMAERSGLPFAELQAAAEALAAAELLDEEEGGG
jgi:aminopeptidase-like protein